MRLTWDPEADAAYLSLVEHVQDGAAVRTVECALGAAGEGVGPLLVDLDAQGRILGFEVLGARDLLPPEALEGAPPPEG